MARPLRLEFPGALYHITSRGNQGLDIFADDADRAAFLSILETTVGRFNWICHAYCLMGNHYHLLVETPDANISRGMRQVNGVYTQYVNRTRKTGGHIFQGRFKAVLVEKDSHLLEAVRYVMLNPVRAGISSSAADWRWSSYRATCGLDPLPPFLAVDQVLRYFGEEAGKALKRFEQFVLDGEPARNPFNGVTGQVVLGSDNFRQFLDPLLKQRYDAREIPVSQRMAARPVLADLFPAGTAKGERNVKLREAVEQWGYSQKEVADFLGLHYSSVSRILTMAAKPVPPPAAELSAASVKKARSRNVEIKPAPQQPQKEKPLEEKPRKQEKPAAPAAGSGQLSLF